MRIRNAKIVQIAALPPGWRHDQWNRCPGMALVEFDAILIDGSTETMRQILPLHEDLSVRFPKEADEEGDAYYEINALGDNTAFLTYDPDREAAY